jgi:hypothetical protein
LYPVFNEKASYNKFYSLNGEGYKAAQDGKSSTVETVREKLIKGIEV